VSDVLEEHRFAGSGRSDQQGALAFADWAEQIHDTHGEWPRTGFESDLFERVDGCQIVKEADFGVFAWSHPVDEFDFVDARSVMMRTGTHLSPNEDSFAETIFFHECRGDKGICIVRDVITFGVAKESVTTMLNFEHSFEGAFDDRCGGRAVGGPAGLRARTVIAAETGAASPHVLTTAVIRTATIASAATIASTFEPTEFTTSGRTIEARWSLICPLFEAGAGVAGGAITATTTTATAATTATLTITGFAFSG
jgi:hypothetical protein